MSTPRFIGSKILFIADQNDWDHEILIIVLVNVDTLQEIISPLLNALVAFSICNVEHNHTAICSSVECVTQRLKSFLACGVPDLERNQLTCFSFNFLFNKVSSYSWFLTYAGFFVLVAFDEARLSDTGVSDYHDLQKLFVSFTICGSRARLSRPLGWAAIRKVSTSFYVLFWNEISPILNLLFFGLRS